MGKIRRSRKPRSISSGKKGNEDVKKAVDGVPSEVNTRDSEKLSQVSKTKQLDAPSPTIQGNPFSNTKIDLSALKTRLAPTSLQEDDRMSFISKGSLRAGKEQLKKKDRMKLRRKRWMEKLAIIDQTRQRRKEKLKRLKTPVVGDLEPMMSALPELSEILKLSEEAGRRADKRRQTLTSRTKKSTLKAKHRQKLLTEERKRFRQVLQHSAFKDNPFAAINKHLALKIEQEESANQPS